MQSTQQCTNAICCGSIKRLTDKLETEFTRASLQQRIDFIGNHPIRWKDVRRHVHRDPCNYHREIVETNEQFQLLVINWLPGQKSPIHNHLGSQCVVRVLSGSAIETVYKPSVDRTFSREAFVYKQGATIGGEDADIHTLENPKTALSDLVTMHVYFPPLKQMDVFAIQNDRLIQTIH